ncbi:MAG: thioredoxin domain-containing protein, partial [Chitinophagaceae bacterium]
LNGVSNAWKNNREDLLQQASNLLAHLKGGSLGDQQKEQGDDDIFTPENAMIVVDNILKTADTVEGGFGKAPKFPQTFSIGNLLFAGTFFKRDDALKQAHLSLKKMIAGGIYDQLGGGIARYSTDAEWLVPHFEKMLYDNALFITTLSEAYQQSGDEEYARVIIQTINFLQHEMRDDKGGYYSALDADSEGEEGKYYVWKKEEIENAVPQQSELICKFYGATEAGNWEGNNILTRKTSAPEFAHQVEIEINEFSNILVEANAQLLKERNKRVRPGTDDKILLSWNAMLISAYCNAYSALADEEIKTEAINLFEFCINKFDDGNGGLTHTYKNGLAKIAGNLEDYATIIEASIALQEITGEPAYLEKATSWLEYVEDHFASP